MKLKTLFLVVIASFFMMSTAFAKTEVSVLVVYTDDARAAVGGTENMETDIVSAIDNGNLAFDNSNVDISLTIADMSEVLEGENNYVSLSRLLSDPNDTTFGIVHQWCGESAADLVYLIFEGIQRNGQANAICGSGAPFDQSFESKAFAVGQRSLQNIAPIVIHELRHVMGLRHECAVEESFESGKDGWRNSSASTCVIGAFVVGTPKAQRAGGVITQVGGASDVKKAFFDGKQ